MADLFNDVSFRVSRVITRSYSTSFSVAVSFLEEERRKAIYSIYGFVRLADEIVDTFHDFDKQHLLNELEQDYYEALRTGLSLNPILNSFQSTVRKYGIADELVQAFLKSMRYDLTKTGSYSQGEFSGYIYGSAEAVGLMCLHVFVNGNKKLFDELKAPAMKLGSAFQKVNFLRDLNNDIMNLNRSYFPQITSGTFDGETKDMIIRDIECDFEEALSGIRRLPEKTKLPVLIAYYYYQNLLEKIRNTPAEKIIVKRIRVHNFIKFILLNKAYFAVKTGIV
jgi:phytoene/squalene synthetase